MEANTLRVSFFLLFLTHTMLSSDVVMVEGLHGLEDMAPKDYDVEYQRLVSLYTGQMQRFRSRMKNGGMMKSLDENIFETGPGMSRVRRDEKMSGDEPGYTGYSSRIMKSPLKSGKI